MEVFRLANEKYRKDLSGKGAALNGGRWNGKGTKLVYTGQNRSLAMAEVSVHINLQKINTIKFFMLTIYVPDKIKCLEVSEDDLVYNWKEFPRVKQTRELGDRIVMENKFCLIKVPSVVVPGDFNYLINPEHKDFNKIKIIDSAKFPFDDRLFYK